MPKSIRLTIKQWIYLKAQLEDEYPPSVTLLRGTMKRRLGFTTRHHGYRNPDTEKWQHDIVLDFFSDSKHTWFLMKYSDFINDV